MKEAIYKLQLTGFKVKAFVFDQETNNVKAISLFTKTSPIIKIADDSETMLFYGTPHLLSNASNNFKSNGFLSEDEKISWCFIERLLIFNNENELHYCPRLTDVHINIPAFKEMNVAKAEQVLSRMWQKLRKCCHTQWQLPFRHWFLLVNYQFKPRPLLNLLIC